MIEYLIKAATCRVTCGTESGTGWLIGADRVVTARHCVLAGIEDGQPVELLFPSTGDVAVASKIVAQSEDWDTCLLSLETAVAAAALPVSLKLPREGEAWRTFGYPGSKSAVGHRLTGTIAQVLDEPRLKIDLDLSVDPATSLQVYKGMSGGAVICNDVVVGIVSKKFDGTVAALSLSKLESFLLEHGVNLPNDSVAPSEPLLADREDFTGNFVEAAKSRVGSYLFLEGAHGYGKSTFCRNFRADDDNVINLGAYCLSDPESALGANYRAQPQVFLEWLTTAISGRITGQAPRKEEKSYAEQIQQTAQYLKAFSTYCSQTQSQGMFFIDGLNEIPQGAMLDALIGLFPTELPPHITIVLTAPNFTSIAGALAGKVKKSDVFELPPLSSPSCYRYCQQALKLERRSSALVDLICEKAKGHPLYLRYLIEYANHQATDDELNEFPILTGPIEEYYQDIWAKLLLDGDAVNLLALIARLRWGVPLTDFAKTLTAAERIQFVSVVSRIRHLLEDEESTTIYHASFATFIVEQTETIGELAYSRLAAFCCGEPGVRYCALNRVFHLSRAGDNTVFAECNQAWFDTAVTLGVEPDALISDVDAVVKRAATDASADEFFRLTLLAQRISFRYNTLFAQSARLIAESLIVLGRPSEALQHVLRLSTLIVGIDEALQISFLLHQQGYNEDALTLLNRVQQRVVESYDAPMQVEDFLKLCSWHIRTIFLIRLAGGGNGMEQVFAVWRMAERECHGASLPPSLFDQCIASLRSESQTYFLTFRDVYADLKSFSEERGSPETELPPQYLQRLCFALIKFETSVDTYHLSKGRSALVKLFEDLAELIPTAEIHESLCNVVTDTLIRFGAPASLVKIFAAKNGKQSVSPLQIIAKNGVDVDQENLDDCLFSWRVAAFLESSFRDTVLVIMPSGWFQTIKHLIGTLYCCDGRSRRAKVDADEVALLTCREQLRSQVIKPLRFSLRERAAWSDSYAIPETALPEIYGHLTELLSDCFPEELPDWLDYLVASADGQWGMYSEGFRNSAFHVLRQLTREKPDEELASRILGLLHALRDHVLRGVENRHELVPEILRMIPIFSILGAEEDAEWLYQRLLSVSMGPTWYKEDQLSIMTEVLNSVAVGDVVGLQLPHIAGYLERASGEMTFQRYVRAEKSVLLGQIARRGKFRAALAYFRRQCCGSTAELWAEAQQGPIDMVGPLKGNRFPGGGVDDQAAVLQLVRNSETVPWTLRWALLEVFHCGDGRHLNDYAEAYARIANEVGARPELLRRMEIVANAETPSDARSSFVSTFREALTPELHVAFADVLVGLPQAVSSELDESPIKQEPEDEEAEEHILHPGLFGRRKALRDGAKILEDAERQWALGNKKAAKVQAIEMLKTAQEGGWSIWGSLSADTRRAEEILVQGEASAANVIRYFAPLIEAENYALKWVPAQHLIGIVGPLLTESESQRLLDVVIDHIRLVVGDAQQEIQAFDFLADDMPEQSSFFEFFRFIVWLCDHPQWLRRERAAAMLLWLVEQVPELFSVAVITAFSMDEGYGPDVLCGVIDGISTREPTVLWDRVVGTLDLTKVTQELRHISRMAVLYRLATRAEEAGSSSAKAAVALIQASFNPKGLTGSNPTLPVWGGRLALEWHELKELIDTELVADWEQKLLQLCSPLNVKDALSLETCVSKSFREGRGGPFDRWESKLRHALNLALCSYVSYEDANQIEAILRVYNPSQPERTVQGVSNSFTDQLMDAIESDDYSNVLGSNAMVMLNYHDTAVKPSEDGAFHVEVLCLLQPTSDRWGTFDPQLDQSFLSSELPVASAISTPFETSCRLEPRDVFFNPFTPATPLPFFQNLVGAKNEAFIRQNWRYGRRNAVQGFGQAERGGCSLSIPRGDLKVPSEFKLAWIIWVDEEIVAFVDEQNNRIL